MAIPCPMLENGSRLVVGSAACAADLLAITATEAGNCCNLVEIRLDLLDAPAQRPWQHLASLPLLFTARRGDEGGSGDLTAQQREGLLQAACDDASLIDIEVASIPKMSNLIANLNARGLPWIASFHNFAALPDADTMALAAVTAREAGANTFKIAAHLAGPEDLERLIEFQNADHGLPKATMGMGPLAARSRVCCAEAGSVLNYGYLGSSPTAPGQVSAAELTQAITSLPKWHGA